MNHDYYGIALIAITGILASVGLVLGIIGLDKGWGYKAWIPLAAFSVIVTVLLVQEWQNNPGLQNLDTGFGCPFIAIPVLLGVVPGIIGTDRGWGYKAWIPLALYSLIVTVLLVLLVQNSGPAWVLSTPLTIAWPIIVTAELLGVVVGIKGLKRGWGCKAWIPLGVALPLVLGSSMIWLVYVG